jgi:hypothetical protein
MLLHEFMSDHRSEILRVCRLELRDRQVEHAEALESHVALFFDEMLRVQRAIPAARALTQRARSAAARARQRDVELG